MKALGFSLVWVVLAVAVLLTAAYRGRAEHAERPYRRTPRGVRMILAVVLLSFGVAVPAAVLVAADDQIPAGSGSYTEASSADLREGRLEFRRTCASCHTLSAAGAAGVTGPNFDGQTLAKAAILAKIKAGGAGGGVMPAGLLEGRTAELVAKYVAAVSGRQPQ